MLSLLPTLRRLTVAATVVAATVTALSGLSRQAAAEQKTITDVLGRTVTVNAPLKRIVLGFYFEDFMAVGTPAAYDSVVGISREAWESWVPANWAMHTGHRPSLAQIADVGEVEVQSFSVEKVLSLKPDAVVLADWQYKALGLDADRLEEAGVPVIVVDYNAQTLERHVASTLVLGEVTGQSARAKEIAAFYKTAVEDVQKRVAAARQAKPRVYVEFGNKGPAEYSFTYGKNMWGAIATAAGGDNIAAPFVEWWGPINPEQVLASKPEAIFLAGNESKKNPASIRMGHGVDATESKARLQGYLSRQGWADLPAVKSGAVYAVYQGASRTLSDFAMVQFFAKQLYPAQFKDIDPVKNYLDYYARYLPVQPKGTFAVSLKD